MREYLRLGKYLTYVLRHKPEDIGIELDRDGFVDVNLLLNAININKKFKEEIVFDDINFVVKNDNKGRFEIKDNKIRALYGHSISKIIMLNKVVPPDILYHGTTQKALNSILEEGLKPMQRQYVHLSKDIETAIEVGKRRDDNPVVLEIDAKRAYKYGTLFYIGNTNTFLCDKILPQYIKIVEYINILWILQSEWRII